MLNSLLLAVLVASASVIADGLTCDLDNKCPKDSPCCSQFGQCGVGAYCLGGCDPRMSFSLDSCVPAPVCQDSTTTFKNLDSIVDIGDYLGDPKDGTWVGQGEPLRNDDTVLLTMPKDSTGTLLSSTTYMWYGNVKARMKTARGQGVVTAFILFSDVKDEIDYEWVGVDLETAQTNYYFQGIPNYKNSENISLSDTFQNFHDYEIRWTPDKIEWLVDGQVGRTKLRKDTWNSTTNQWEFPQTPARVQFSLWPAGSPKNPKGTVDWAGGLIKWDTPDIESPGFYFATIESISMECYNAKSPPGTNNGKSYTYDNAAGTNDTVVNGDKDTVLASLQGSGTDMDAGAPAKGSKPHNTAQIPGQGGASGQDHSGSDSNQSGVNTDSGSSGSSGSGGGSSGGSGGSSSDANINPSNCDPSKFNANCGTSSANTDGGDGSSTGTKSSASALAMIIAGTALFWL